MQWCPEDGLELLTGYLKQTKNAAGDIRIAYLEIYIGDYRIMYSGMRLPILCVFVY